MIKFYVIQGFAEVTKAAVFQFLLILLCVCSLLLCSLYALIHSTVNGHKMIINYYYFVLDLLATYLYLYSFHSCRYFFCL